MSDLTMHLPHGQLSLAANKLLRLSQAQGTRLQGVAGTLWVTFDGCPQDLVLEAGDSLTIHNGGDVTVSSLGGAATLAVDEAATASPAAAGPLTAPLRRALQALRAQLAPRPSPCPA